MSEADPFDLQRFVDAQADGVYEQAQAELRQGQKLTHWMWFIFPQHVDLGHSPTARHFGLSGVSEARAYVEHPVLRDRLLHCCDAILPHLRGGKPAADILGQLDAMKLRSSMEIFAAADAGETRFAEILALA